MVVSWGRCLAPDLTGMGDSDKLPNSGPGSYRFVEHRRYLDALLEELGVRERVTLVVQDWGSGLGFDWANRHREAVRGIAYMGALVQPRGWNDWPEATRILLKAARSPAGKKMALEGNLFEQALTSGILRTLSEEELAERVNDAADRLWPAIAQIASGRKVIVIGSSQGAMLAYALAARHPKRVAHAFPISGSAPRQIFLPGRVPAPVHAVHGTEDRVIPIELDRSTVRAFKEHGGVAELDELPGVGHAFTKDIRHHVLVRLQSILVGGRLPDAGSTQPVTPLRDQ